MQAQALLPALRIEGANFHNVIMNTREADPSEVLAALRHQPLSGVTTAFEDRLIWLSILDDGPTDDEAIAWAPEAIADVPERA